jgi:glutamine synthetase
MRSPPRPIVLLPACERWIDGRPLQSVRQQYLDALHAVGLQALVVPTSTPPDWDRLLPLADGLLLTGSPSNIEPGHYGAALQTPELPLDPARDAAVLPLVPRVLASGLPLLAICRGFQEMNVALGGSLHQQVHAQAGLLDHRDLLQPYPSFAHAHSVRLQGGLARLLQAEEIRSPNSNSGSTSACSGRVTEVECLVPDLTGVARGKILPRVKFTEDRGMRLPEAVVAMGVTGEFPERGPYYDVIRPDRPDMHLRPTRATVRIVPWATDPTAQVIHDCYDRDGRLVPFAPRSVLRRVCDLYAAEGLGAGGGARAGVLPGGPQHRPRHRCAADRPQRPRRDLAPGLQHRRGQRVRPAVRGRLRLLRQDGAERRHADPRDRRRADGDQLLPRPPAGPGRRGVPLQAHGARGGAAPRHVRHLHGQADRRRARQRHAHAPEHPQQGSPAEHLQQRGRQPSGGVPLVHRRPAALHPGRDGAVRALRQQLPPAGARNAAPINIQWGTDNRTVGIRSPLASAAGAAHREPRDRRRRQPLRGAGRHAGLRLPGHQEQDRAHARVQGRRLPGRLPAAAQPGRGAGTAARREGPGRGAGQATSSPSTPRSRRSSTPSS